MEKILIFAVVICLLVSLVSCVAKSSGNDNADFASREEVKATATTTTSTATTVSTTTVAKSKVTTAIKEKSASQIIAGLINEDGTGEIQINMTKEQVQEVLKKNGVTSKVANPEWIDIEDGMRYKLGSLQINQTKKGLKKGDPIERVYELYLGAKEAYQSDEAGAYFYFAWEKKFDVAGVMYNSGMVIALNKAETNVEGISIGLAGF
jgi:hypothetical protein